MKETRKVTTVIMVLITILTTIVVGMVAKPDSAEAKMTERDNLEALQPVTNTKGWTYYADHTTLIYDTNTRIVYYRYSVNNGYSLAEYKGPNGYNCKFENARITELNSNIDVLVTE